MTDAGYQMLLESLNELDVPEDAKEAFRKLVAETATAELPPYERVQFARRLLNAREPRNIICQRLMNRFEIGRSQAYRDIVDALQIVPS